jgi:hypothetical protein
MFPLQQGVGQSIQLPLSNCILLQQGMSKGTLEGGGTQTDLSQICKTSELVDFDEK